MHDIWKIECLFCEDIDTFFVAIKNNTEPDFNKMISAIKDKTGVSKLRVVRIVKYSQGILVGMDGEKP